MTMTDRIKQAIANHAAEDLASALQDAGVECNTRFTAQWQPTTVDVLGYGSIFYDGTPGSPCGWGIAGDDPKNWAPVTEDELTDDMTDLVAAVQKVS